MTTQPCSLGDDINVVHKFKDFPKVCKSERCVTFFQVSVYKVNEAEKPMSGGGGLHVAKLL